MNPNAQPRRVLAAVLFALMLAPVSSALLDEDQGFQPQHVGVDFPVGFTEFNLGGPFSPQVRMIYPAMVEGEDKEMAGNGPFPWLLFIGDSGEDTDGYMMLTEKIVQRGYIVVVSQPLSDETDIEAALERFVDVSTIMEQQNQSNIHVLGSAGNIDVHHWGVAGHGKGAAAAYLAFPFWELSDRSTTHQPPRALFGLGLDLADVEETFSWTQVTQEPAFPRPNTALFLTGTVDEIAPSQATMEQVESIGGLGWQWMHVLGADHYQFQDTRSFFENDGDPTMSQSAQIQLTADHVIPYLDTVLRGEHDRFRDAFNRADGPRTVSDSSAYVDESLEDSSFLRLNQFSVSHNDTVELNASETFVMHTNWTLRNGDGFSDLPAEWDVHVACGWQSGDWESTGTVEANGSATCSFPMAPVAPGLHKAWMRVEVEGAPSTAWGVAVRGNTPLELLYPQPTVYIPQHGSSTLAVNEIANDPDGQSVRVLSASLSGVDANHFAVEIDSSRTVLHLHHALDEEWLGECMLDLQLRSDGQVIDEQNTSLRVVLTPVNDPVIKSGNVPIQEMNEDGDPLVYDLGEVVSDPENEPLLIRIDGQTIGEQGPVRFLIEGERLTLTPREDANGVTVLKATVSDGVNTELEVEIPVVVNAVDDPVVINATSWTNLSTDEDTTYVLDVTPLAYDVDGDPLVWTLEGGAPNLAVTWTNGSFVLEPSKDFNGLIDNLWLNVTDGGSAYEHLFTLDVRPVGDLPFVAISAVQRVDGGSTATMQWSLVDVDGTADTNALVLVDAMAVTVNHSCLSSSPGAYQCVTLLPLPATQDSLNIELSVHDGELDRTVVTSFVFDPDNASSVKDTQDTAAQGGDGLNASLLLGALGLLGVLSLGAMVLMKNRSPSNPPVEVHSDTEQPQERTSESKGLLARAKERQ